MVNFHKGEPFQTNTANIKAVVDDGKWCILIHVLDSSDESAVFFDGTNQYALSQTAASQNLLPQNGFVSETEVPYGGQFGQTAWFHFCKQRWASLSRNAFPNFMSYEGKQGINNLTLTLAEAANGFEATLDFVDGNTRWPVEKWHAEGVDSRTGVPKFSERTIYSRVGTLFNGKLLLPSPGRTFEKRIQVARTEVSSIEVGDFRSELTPPWLGHGPVRVVDKRFSTNGSLLTYTATNRFPTTNELQTVSPIRYDIALMRVSEAKEKFNQNGPRNILYLIGLLLFGAGVVLAAKVKRNQRSISNHENEIK